MAFLGGFALLELLTWTSVALVLRRGWREQDRALIWVTPLFAAGLLPGNLVLRITPVLAIPVFLLVEILAAAAVFERRRARDHGGSPPGVR